MSRKSRKKREAKLRAQRDRRSAAARLGARRQVRAVKYQEVVRDRFGMFRCPECKRSMSESHDRGCANTEEEVEHAKLVDAREKRQIVHEGKRDVIPDKPTRLTRGPAAVRKVAMDMVTSLREDDLTLYGVREIVDIAKTSSLNERDLAWVQEEADKRFRQLEEENSRNRKRIRRGLFPKKFRPGKKL